MELIDTHCHIDLDEFNNDRHEVLQRAKFNGVSKIIVPATVKKRWTKLIKLCDSNSILFPALGLHPMFIEQHDLKNDIDDLTRFLKANTIIAVGEIGLDYYHDNSNKFIQLALLEAQLTLALQHELPVILHCRKAYDDLLKLLKKCNITCGICHAFNGSLQQAQELIELGLKLGFGGTLTFPRSTKIRKLAANLPLTSLVLETDAPFMSVRQFHQQRNSPEYLPMVLDSLVEIRKENRYDITKQLYKNSMDVFFNLCRSMR